MPEDLKYPLAFLHCPICGGDGVAKLTAQEMFRTGRMIDPNIKPSLGQSSAAIIDPTIVKNQETVVALITFYDSCSKCGNIFSTLIDRREVPNTQFKPASGLILPEKPNKPLQDGRWPVGGP